MTKILFASWHFYLDQSNGASITVRELLRALSRQGDDVSTFCADAMDYNRQASLDAILELHGIHGVERLHAPSSSPDYSIRSFFDGRIKSIVFSPVQSEKIPNSSIGRAFLEFFDLTLKKTKPEIVLTYGGYWFGAEMIEIAKRHNAKVVILLQNFSYQDSTYFQNADLVLVPSHYAAGYYRGTLGIEALVAPPVIDWRKIVSPEAVMERRYVLFVNPELRKGALFFSRLVERISELRNDVPFLVIEASATGHDLSRFDRKLLANPTVFKARNTPLPRDFYSLAKITLVPSLFLESFGRVGAESMIAGVPVVASTRGALPEVLGDAASLLDIPKEYAPETAIMPPTRAGVDAWVKEIIRLWDDDAYYAKKRKEALTRAQAWTPQKTLEAYQRAFNRLLDR
ncbi:MAG: glycosyltransferase [Planctomycetia bacterium]|nr:glycosyltransferase [Planctomycetia bacterium]